MHIVQCLTQNDLGGGQVAVFNLVQGFRRWYPQVQFTVVLPPRGIFVERFRDLGVAVREFPLNRIHLSKLSLRNSFLQGLFPDVIHSHGKGAGLYVRSISRRRLAARRFHSYHGFHPPNVLGASSLYLILESYLLRNTDRVISVSPSEAEEVRRRFPHSSEKVALVPNVVNPRQILHEAKTPLSPTLHAYLLLNKGNAIVTMIARDDAVKDYPLAIASAQRLLDEKKKVAFVFIGVSGSNGYFQSLRNSFPSRVLGLTQYETPAAVINKSDLVLLTSKKEGLPFVLQEALCLGKPVVATNVEGTRDLVRHGVNGLLCERTVESVSRTIMDLVESRTLQAKLSQGARRFSKTLNPRAWVQRYFNLYSGKE
ncbi:MAG: glycosyltransferase [Ignavibacteriales bacterium]|nr:glycosyltransferase [Ignavibacteriales bacterium]